VREDSCVERTELLIAWARGWAVSRGRPEPLPVTGGVRIPLGHAERHVTTTSPGWLRDDDVPIGTVLKVFGPLETGEFGIVDKVDTVPAHGRRGLATAALAVLGNWAVDHGLRIGVLAATDQGAPLYRRLGWTSHGPIAGAVYQGTYEKLVAEAAAVPLRGWDFSWIAGRATGSDPSWSYPDVARELVARSKSLLDLDTGGGELLASLGPLPPATIATEGWEPNLAVARQRLGVDVRFTPGPELPVDTGSVDLVLNRHGRLDPAEVARVLRPGGVLLTQQVGSDDCAEINDALGASPAYDETWDAATATKRLTAAGLTVTEVREEWPEFVFHDVGALVFQLRAVAWQVPDFTVEKYADALRRIHERGEFRARSHRFLIRAER
jgi:SAM-dependent methyltransferase